MSDVRAWLEGLDLSQYADVFEENDIDARALPELSDQDLRDVGVTSLGHRRVLLGAIKQLSASVDGVSLPRPEAPAPRREAERRQITVMFCDLVGSTALSETLDPEELRGVIGAYRKACTDVIARYEGYVAQYLGDGVMAYFGWPRAHEDDAARSVRAALETIESVATLEAKSPLEIRVGIATGLVVVGESGAESELAIGETPNVAARVQAIAEPGTVAIAQATRRLLGGAFTLEDLGIRDAKGVSGGLTVHRVLGEAVAESRFEAARGMALTPLAGRESETAMLLDRWDRAADGEGQAVVLSGEPGIGKSRLLQVLTERLTGEAHTQLRYQCSPYYASSAFYPIIGQLERTAGFDRDDSAEQKLDKLEALLAGDVGDAKRTAALIAAMMSLPVDRYPPLALSPQRQKDDTIAALAARIVALATDRTVLILFEDVHWCDSTTLEVLGAVIDAIREAKVLLVITHRPEFASPWSEAPHLTAQSLARLGRRQGAQMVARVTGGKPLPDEVLDQIVAKTDGIPLFVEELTKTVLEAGFLSERDDRYVLDGPLPPLAIPATLQDSLMARLDRLSPVKEVAQVAACIGREFSYELLSAVSPLHDNELQDALQQLVSSELVFRRGSGADAAYTFKHALVQDSAYETLLKSRRQQLHQTIASALGEHFPGQVAAEPALLAHHLTEAGLYDRAIPAWHQAGQAAFLASSYAEAITNITTAIDLLPQIDEEAVRGQMEVGLQTLLGLSYQNTIGFGAHETGNAMRRAGELLGYAGSAAEQVSILSVTAGYHWLAGGVPAAADFYERAWQTARDS